MKKTHNLEPGCFYIFKSLSAGNTCYFETENELIQFNKLFKFHLHRYIRIVKANINQEGYVFLIKIRDNRTLISNYKKERVKKGKKIDDLFIQEPWRIISEKIRIVHSLFVRFANKLRDRSGVLVKKSYEKFYFENIGEAIEQLENDSDLAFSSQKNKKYKSIKSHCQIKNWVGILAKNGMQVFKNQTVTSLILLNYVKKTISAHLQANTPFHTLH